MWTPLRVPWGASRRAGLVHPQLNLSSPHPLRPVAVKPPRATTPLPCPSRCRGPLCAVSCDPAICSGFTRGRHLPGTLSAGRGRSAAQCELVGCVLPVHQLPCRARRLPISPHVASSARVRRTRAPSLSAYSAAAATLRCELRPGSIELPSRSLDASWLTERPQPVVSSLLGSLSRPPARRRPPPCLPTPLVAPQGSRQKRRSVCSLQPNIIPRSVLRPSLIYPRPVRLPPSHCDHGLRRAL